jgi:tripartite-type tricarboxylate transporter receptor subunit TctC
LFAADATAQALYPSRPVRIIVPITPGSPPDVLARLLGEKLAPAMGQPVVVQNRPGASGTIGIDAVTKASADGYTLGMLTLGFLTAPALVATMPYDTARDLAAVSLVSKDSNLLVVASASPIASVADLIRTAKAKPATLKFASGGNSTSAHLVGELFRREAGVDIVHIPYKGPVAGVTAVIAGDVDMMFGAMGAVATHVRSGRLRALAVSAPQRVAAYPEVATLVEIGFPRITFSNWFGVVAPAATPSTVVARLHREIQAIGAAPETRLRLEVMGLEAAMAGPAEFSALIRSDLQRMSKLVRDAGIQPD